MRTMQLTGFNVTGLRQPLVLASLEEASKLKHGRLDPRELGLHKEGSQPSTVERRRGQHMIRNFPEPPTNVEKAPTSYSHLGSFGPEIPKESQTNQKRVSRALQSQGSKKSKRVKKESKKSEKRVRKGHF